MKKIIFNDKYGLTNAVLEGRKTQTRRILNPTMLFQRQNTYEGYKCWRLRNGQYCDDCPEYSDCPANNDDN